MNVEKRHFLGLHISNAAQVGSMAPGDYLSFGMGNSYIFNISCFWVGVGSDTKKCYAFDVLQNNIVLNRNPHTSLAHSLAIYGDFATTDFD